MAWSTPPTFTSGNVLTAAQKNIERDNFNETAPAMATSGGGVLVTTAVNQIRQRTPGAAETLPDVSTTSTGYVALSGGPAVTAVTGPTAYCWVTAMAHNNNAGSGARMSVDNIGSHAPGDSTCLAIDSAIANVVMRATCLVRISGLTAGGSNTFTAHYRATANTATFRNRRIDIQQIS